MPSMDEPAATPRRRTVATRVLFSYVFVTVVFALVAGWGVFAQRSAAREADLMRSGYLPLSLSLRDLVGNQDTWNTQLNHITTARNPADKRAYFETALRIGRPRSFGEVRAALNRAFETSGDESVRQIGEDLTRETNAIEEQASTDRELITKLFEVLDRNDEKRADQLRDELVTRGTQNKKRMRDLEQRVQGNVDLLLDRARARERLAIQLLIGLSILTVLVGAAMALYARRVLRPLAAVTERAKAVATGDLTPRPVVPSNDEIGELAATFEGMVAAIQRANEQLLSTERLATIGKMAAHVTHEVRNPLSSIALNVELLEEELTRFVIPDGGESRPDAKESAALLRAIKSEVERLTALTEEYLSVARRQPTKLVAENLAELVAEACEFMRADLKKRGVEAVLELDDVGPVPVDEPQLKQALFNLVRNAREAMPEGGRIVIGVHEAAEDGVNITVDDEGSGIAEETRQHLFEPFYTTKDHGTGLGLAITRQIVEAHGGSIACEALKSGGTRFSIHLPRVEAPKSASPA
jgi:two-component system NtrC family sensor kinase